MYIDVVFTPYELPSRDNINSKSIIVIDVLRATTTIAYALWGYRKNSISEILGCSKIIPVKTLEEAVELSKKFDRKDILVTGERHCLKPEGFDLGNSPSEYTPDRVQDKTIIFTTTNGTRSLKLAEKSKFIATGAFVNATACSNRTYEEQNDILILCAGRSNKTTKEDSACAGLIAKLLSRKCEENDQDYELSDSADIAIKFFDHYKNDIFSMLKNSEAGKSLIKIGLEKDLEDCCMIDVLSISPVYKDGYIDLY